MRCTRSRKVPSSLQCPARAVALPETPTLVRVRGATVTSKRRARRTKTVTDGAVHRCGSARGKGTYTRRVRGAIRRWRRLSQSHLLRTPPVRQNARAKDYCSDNSRLASED